MRGGGAVKELTEEEYNDRMGAIKRAKKIFIDSGVTENITTAFKLYQEVFAEREREIFISNQNSKSAVMARKYDRPVCPDCGVFMKFRSVRENAEGVKMQLICENPQCDTVLNSEHDTAWWQNELRKKDGFGGVSTGVEEVQQKG